MKLFLSGCFCFFMATTVCAQTPKSLPAMREVAPIADFKLDIKLHGAGSVPIGVAELVVRDGLAYQFLSDNRDEVLVIDWTKGSILLVDLDRKIKTSVSATRLDEFLKQLYKDATEVVDRETKSKSRGERVNAEISGPLIDPQFKEAYDEKTQTLKLENRSVVIDAKGIAETDDARRNVIASCLIAVNQLGAMRDATLIPPFTRLEALKILLIKYKLRPIEMIYVYRLAGPPQKLRWTYELSETLSDRETEAISRLNKVIKFTPEVTFDTYQPPTGE